MTVATICVEPEQSEEASQRLLAQVYNNPDNSPLVLYQRGRQYAEAKNYVDAEVNLVAAIKGHPDFILVFETLGRLYRDWQKPHQAALCYKAITLHCPEHANAWFELGNCYYLSRIFVRAIKPYEKAVAISPDWVDARMTLGLCHLALENTAEALIHLERAVALAPDNANAHLNRGAAYLRQGQYANAERDNRTALRLDDALASAWGNLGMIADQQHGDTQTALAYYEKALTLSNDPAQIHWNMAYAQLRAGLFEAGWQSYDWRWKTHWVIKPTFETPEWDGSPMPHETLMVYTDGGFGDTLQFARLLPAAKSYCNRLVLYCDPELKTVLQQTAGMDEIVDTDAALPTHDRWVCITDLCRLFNLNGSTLGMPNAYIQPITKRVAYWQTELWNPKKLKVGLVWAGSLQTLNGRNRTCPFEKLLPLLELNKHKNVHFYGLQHGPHAQDSAFVPCDAFTDMAPCLTDFNETAAILANLDLLITIDTAMAHLAGAMGKPVWVMLPFAAEWRWFKEAEHTPWYPTMRLFRQASSNNWNPVIQDVSEALKVRLLQES